MAYITKSVGALWIHTIEQYFWFGTFSSFQTVAFHLLCDSCPARVSIGLHDYVTDLS